MHGQTGMQRRQRMQTDRPARVHGFRRKQRSSGRVSGGQVPNSTEPSADSGVKKDCEKFRSAEEKHQSDS